MNGQRGCKTALKCLSKTPPFTAIGDAQTNSYLVYTFFMQYICDKIILYTVILNTNHSCHDYRLMQNMLNIPTHVPFTDIMLAHHFFLFY